MAGAAADSHALRRALIETLRREDRLHSDGVAQAMLDVPRECFVPGLPLDEVYRPAEAIVTKRVGGVSVSSASAPEVVALMLEQLDPRPGDRVLEIGAGTGYNAALLQHLVGDRGHVVSLDIDEDLVISARTHLHTVGYPRVEVVQGDGALGFPSSKAFDRIVLTVASADIAPAWHEQLATPHGRLVLPLALGGPQRSIAFTWVNDHLQSASIRNCSFIPLRGLLAAASPRVPLDAAGNLLLVGGVEPPPLAPKAIGALLRGPWRVTSGGVSLSIQEVRDGLHLWLAGHVPGMYSVWGDAHVPDLFGLPERLAARGTLAAIDATGLVLLAWADETRRGGELRLLATHGAQALAERLREQVARWAERGRPGDEQLTVRAYPRRASPPQASDEVRIDQRWSTFLLSWASSSRDYPPAILTV